MVGLTEKRQLFGRWPSRSLGKFCGVLMHIHHDAYEAASAGGVGVVLVGCTAVQNAAVVDDQAVALLKRDRHLQLGPGEYLAQRFEGLAPVGR